MSCDDVDSALVNTSQQWIQQSPLMEFAIGNIAEEVLGEQFNVWFGRRAPMSVWLCCLRNQDQIEASADRNLDTLRISRLKLSVSMSFRYLQGDLSDGSYTVDFPLMS